MKNMHSRLIVLTVLITAFSLNLPAQHIDEGYYNGWDFGPRGVYGNLLLKDPQARRSYHIEKKDPQTVLVKMINPSGVVLNTARVSFIQGTVSKVEEINQWGEIYNVRSFSMTGKDTLKVTDFSRGVNNYLPCKYALFVYKDELLTEIQYYSSTGELTESKNGYATVRYKRYDDKIRFAEIREESFFDAQGRPMISKARDYHKAVYDFDDRDNKLSETYFGILDEPVRLGKSNVARTVNLYDDNNNSVKIEWYNMSGTRTENINGVGMTITEWAGGYPVKFTRYDSTGRIARASSSGDGISVVKVSHDARGNIISEAYFDEGGKPMKNQLGIFESVNAYTPFNMLSEVSYLDDSGNPMVNRDHIHKYVYIRDSIGRILRESFYGLEGVPVKSYTDEVYMIKYQYDEFGRRVFESYWMDNANPMPRWSGTYQMTTRFNGDGQPVEFGYNDQNGNALRTADGSSDVKLIYNSVGKVAERQYLHENRLITRRRGVTNGYSTIRYGYDKKGRVEQLSFFDKDNHPIDATISMDSNFQAHQLAFIYRGNRVVEQWYYLSGADTPFLKVDCLKNDFISTSGISRGRKNAE
jgi:hypothetical protein